MSKNVVKQTHCIFKFQYICLTTMLHRHKHNKQHSGQTLKANNAKHKFNSGGLRSRRGCRVQPVLATACDQRWSSFQQWCDEIRRHGSCSSGLNTTDWNCTMVCYVHTQHYLLTDLTDVWNRFFISVWFRFGFCKQTRQQKWRSLWDMGMWPVLAV